MSTPYAIKYGDTLTLIAHRHGLSSWRDIYYHPDNAAFRIKRPNPDKIYPRDVVMIPIAGPTKPPPTAPPPVQPKPVEPVILSTRFALVQPGDANELMNDDGDFFFRIIDAQNPNVPQIYWLGPPRGYKHLTTKVEIGRDNFKRRSTFSLKPPGRAITDLQCRAFYVTRYKKGHKGPLNQLFLGLKPHPVTIDVDRPYLPGSGSGPYNFQRSGQFQLVEDPEKWIVDTWLPTPFG
ncbi:MAG: hypothetical protein ACYTG0_19300 [Planctomycetota bacterium]|jgi:hypothetical protein